jgi:ABC-type glycerol-3-phosphate transport system substrate-binding protein
MALRPIDDLIANTQFDMDVFFPALVEEVTWMDRTFALPANTASYAFFYNKTLMAEAGLNPDRPPKNWNEVREYSKVMSHYDDQGRMLVAGFLPPFSGGHTGILGNLSIAALQSWQLGADYVSDGGTVVNMDGPELLRAAKWTRSYYEDYDFETVQAFIGGLGTGEQHGFLTGKLGMVVLDMSFLDLIRRYRPDMDYGIVETPSFEGYPTASMAGSWWLGIPRGASNPRAAWDFMRFVTRADIQLEELAARDDDLFPANRKAAADSSFIVSPEIEVFVRQMEFAHSPIVVPLAHGVFWREFYGALERTVHGQQSAEEAFAQAEKLVQESLDRSSEYDAYVRENMTFLED